MGKLFPVDWLESPEEKGGEGIEVSGSANGTVRVWFDEYWYYVLRRCVNPYRNAFRIFILSTSFNFLPAATFAQVE